MEPILQYAYVVASPYSGTTLLSLLIDSHPRIVSIGEVDNNIHEYPADPPYLCSCGRPIDRCEFFTRVQDLCAREGVELDLHDFHLKLGCGLGRVTRRLMFGSALRLEWLEKARDGLLGCLPSYQHIKQVFDRNSAIARAVLNISGKEILVDASKGVARGPHLLRRPEIDLRVVHVVRDVRAVAWSGLKHWRARLGNSAPCSTRMQRAQIENTARFWVRTHRAALQLRTLVGEERYFLFRWEDFCTTPQPVLAQICEFLGVEPIDLLSRVNAETHHVIGNGIRLRPVRSIRSDETWREALAPSQRVAAERYAAELNRSFGYA